MEIEMSGKSDKFGDSFLHSGRLSVLFVGIPSELRSEKPISARFEARLCRFAAPVKSAVVANSKL
jgi:hypothetical protein